MENLLIENLLVGLTFHFNYERIKYLEKVTTFLDDLAVQVRLIIVTNTKIISELQIIRDATRNKNFQIFTAHDLEHPHLLTWQHMDLFRGEFVKEPSITHFMYLEDDIQIKQKNISYWLKAREELRDFGFVPSFVRYEIMDNNLELRSTDILKPMIYGKIPKLVLTSSYSYLNLKQPYQGMYLLDRELAIEHLFQNQLKGRSGSWGVRETAASALTFINVPSGFTSRNLVGFYSDEFEVDSGALIHHLPNNYANNPNSGFGKIKISQVVLKRRNYFSLIVETKTVTIATIQFIKRFSKKIISIIKNI